MVAPTIPNGEEQFFNILYEGNGGGQRVGNFVPFADSGTIANSLIFNRADNPRLAITPSSASNRKTFTFSAWIKRANLGSARNLILTVSPTNGASGDFWYFDTNDTLKFTDATSSYYTLVTNRTFEDTSKWYHLLIAVDTTQATASNRMKVYIDGDQISSFSTETYPSQDFQFEINNTTYPMNLGGDYGSAGAENAGYYLAEVNIVDGTALTPSTFGETDTSTGRWVPKSLTGITYGTNGFRLQFGSSSALGDDTSGNTNDFSVSNLVASDQVTDSPTQNFATLTPNRMKSGFTLSEGNLKMVSNSTDGLCMSGMRVSGGKFYIETEVDAFTNGGSQGIGFCEETLSTSTDPSEAADVFGIFSNQTDFVVLRDGAQAQDNGGALAAGNIVQIAFDGSDLGNAKFYLGINNSKWYYEDMSENSSFDATRPTLTLDLRARTNLRFYVGNRASTGSPGSSTYICNFGQKSYSYTAPTGFGSFNQDALPETAKGVSGLVWMKNRDATDSHQLYDSSRGKQLVLESNNISASTTVADGLQKFLKGGQQIEDSVAINTSGESYVSWNWVANNSTTASNTNGALTSTVQANTTAGFSIIRYTGNGVVTTIGHGLSQPPEWFIVWHEESLGSPNYVYHKSMGADYRMLLNNSTTRYNAVNTPWNDTAPTSSTISLMSTGYGGNNSGAKYIIYAWHGVEGFSKFGSYTGNGNSDGPFIYTGFRPAWVMFKHSTVATGWYVYDTKRSKFNPVYERFFADNTNAEGLNGDQGFDILSNGFKIRQPTGYGYNNSGATIIYMAFAEHPFVGDGTNPVVAR